MLEILEIKDFDSFFGLMEQSFSIDEYRIYEEQKVLLDNAEYRIYVKYSTEREIVGFNTVWNFDEFAYIEHFAVNPRFRNGGIGAGMLDELSETLNKMICLEVELRSVTAKKT